jgi:hypothetical protein
VVLDTGPLKEANLAQVQASNSGWGVGDLETRTKRLRAARRSFWSLVVLGILLPPLLVAITFPSPAPLDLILILEGMWALQLLLDFWVGLGGTPFFVNSTFYADRIPARALWNPHELGQFPASDVSRVVVRLSGAVDLAWLHVTVYSRTGQEARFSGFTREAMMATADRRGVILEPKAKAELLARGGGAGEILEWAREHHVPITVEQAFDRYASAPAPN